MSDYTILSFLLFALFYTLMHLYLLNKSHNHTWKNFNLFVVIVNYISITIEKNGRIGFLFYFLIISLSLFFLSLIYA
jgi:hypothetical protein